MLEKGCTQNKSENCPTRRCCVGVSKRNESTGIVPTKHKEQENVEIYNAVQCLLTTKACFHNSYCCKGVVKSGEFWKMKVNKLQLVTKILTLTYFCLFCSKFRIHMKFWRLLYLNVNKIQLFYQITHFRNPLFPLKNLFKPSFWHTFHFIGKL